MLDVDKTHFAINIIFLQAKSMESKDSEVGNHHHSGGMSLERSNANAVNQNQDAKVRTRLTVYRERRNAYDLGYVTSRTNIR